MDILFNSRVCLIPVLPDFITEAIKSELSYTHRKSVRGKESWEKLGKAYGNVFTRLTFVNVEPDGRLCVPAGFTRRICDMLKSFGYNPNPIPHGFASHVPNWERLKARVKFRESQEETLQTLLSVYHGGVDAAPGYGKGFTIWCLSELLDQATFDVVADSCTVCRQLEEYLEPYIPGVGFFGDGTHRKHPRVNIYSLDSLHYSDGSADYLVVDEVHTAVAEKASSKFSHYKNSRRIWFSGSPEGRGDNADIRVEALFGKPVVEIPYQECVRMGLVVNLHVKWLDMDLPFNPLEGITDSHMRNKLGIWRNVHRNQKFAQAINELPAEDQSLVLVSKVEHLCNLFPLLQGYKFAFGANKQSLQEAMQWAEMGYLNKSDLEDRAKKNEAMRKDFSRGNLKRVLVTSIWDTGANFPKLMHVTRTDPSDSNKIKDKQAPSRGSRIDDGNKDIAYVHDAVDRWDQEMYDKSLARRRRYSSQGWEESGWVDRG
jgi:superfamily II DNA or RNA helicase